MTKGLKWQDDPVVLLEKAVHPIVSMIPMAIVRKELDQKLALDGVSAQFAEASEMLHKTSIQMLHRRKIAFRPEQVQPILEAAGAIDVFGGKLLRYLNGPPDKTLKMQLLSEYTDSLVDLLEAAIDAFRSVFISNVLETQARLSQRADDAIGRLDAISKQIFFISINAGVEAARVGEAGQGFQQISTDIRALSQSAQDATRDLSDLVT